MGYKCDVCSTEDAAIFCFADQAVMCSACDTRVHSANKVVRKHERVSLQKESESATCDICQEHKAIMFCSEDRALICRRCDLMIHTANEFVAKHHRYLLSGVAVGLKALDIDGKDIDDCEGKSKKPYSLRNTSAVASGSGRDRDSWKTGHERSVWRGSNAEPSSAPRNGLSSNPTPGSQPSLIGMNGNEQLGHAMSLGALTGASLITPFGTKEEQTAHPSSSPSDSPPAAHQEAGPSTSAWGGWGMDESMLRPGSSDFTLAAELLGMPSVSQGFTAKDIDAAYIFDDEGELDANLSALLEVPDLDFLQADHPTLINHHQAAAAVPGVYPMDGAPNGRMVSGKAMSPADGVVPDLHHSDIGSFKRQRIQ